MKFFAWLCLFRFWFLKGGREGGVLWRVFEGEEGGGGGGFTIGGLGKLRGFFWYWVLFIDNENGDFFVRSSAMLFFWGIGVGEFCGGWRVVSAEEHNTRGSRVALRISVDSNLKMLSPPLPKKKLNDGEDKMRKSLTLSHTPPLRTSIKWDEGCFSREGLGFTEWKGGATDRARAWWRVHESPCSGNGGCRLVMWREGRALQKVVVWYILVGGCVGFLIVPATFLAFVAVWGFNWFFAGQDDFCNVDRKRDFVWECFNHVGYPRSSVSLGFDEFVKYVGYRTLWDETVPMHSPSAFGIMF